jgi:aspartyl-tRNA(Asn)/glutamyl-tRNA(Gln) amidotransferase subunit A
MRIGLPKGAWENVQPAVRENFLKSVDVLKALGHTVTEIDYPDMPYGPTISVIVDAEGASAFEDILRDGRAKLLRAKADQIGGYESAATLAIDYLRAQRVRAKVRETLSRLFETVDLVVSPTRATVAFPIGPNFNDAYPAIRGGPAIIPSMNLLGAPAMAMPNGFGENGLPTSIQFNAAPANEVLLVNAAIHFQNATGFFSLSRAKTRDLW